MSGHKALQIGRAAPGKMRARDPKMVEQCGKAGLDRRVIRRFSVACHGRSPCFDDAVCHETISNTRRRH
jgi:hypothetical protein